MSQHIEIKVIAPSLDNIDFIQEVLASLWSNNHILTKDKKFFKWAYIDFNDKSKFAYVKNNDDVIGCALKQTLNGKSYNHNIFISSINCLVVKEAFQKYGVGLKLLKELYCNSEIITNIGSTEKAMKLYKALGHKLYQPFTRFNGIYSKDRFKSFLDVLKNDPYKPQCTDFKEYMPLYGSLSHIIHRSFIEVNKNEFNNFIDLWEYNKVSVYKSYDFILWRYINHPIFDYECVVFFDHNMISGLLVYRKINIRDSIYIIRVLELIGDNQTQSKMLDYLYSKEKSDVAYVDISIEGINKSLYEIHNMYKNSNYFSKYYSPPDYRYTTINGSIFANDKNIDLNNMYLSLADTDQDAPGRVI